MKNFLYTLFVLTLFSSCTPQKNTNEFINNSAGRYLFSADEVLEIHFKEQILQVKWRGNDNIEPLKVNDTSFYMKALNEKILFVKKPKMHIELAPKTEHDGITYHFKKMEAGEKTPSEYFMAKEYKNALAAFLEIKKQDSLSPIIDDYKMNKLGYEYLRKNNFDIALEVFKINVALHPTNSNVFDSLGEAYLLQKDTLNAEINFKKAISINPENDSAKRFLTKITK